MTASRHPSYNRSVSIPDLILVAKSPFVAFCKVINISCYEFFSYYICIRQEFKHHLARPRPRKDRKDPDGFFPCKQKDHRGDPDVIEFPPFFHRFSTSPGFRVAEDIRDNPVFQPGGIP